MNHLLDFPRLFFGLSFVLLCLSEWIGVFFRKRRGNLEGEEREDFNLITAATLTLLGLIIGFSFSMAINRYDLRKNYEEAEANAIGTEYVRAGLLPAPDAEKLRAQLRKYTDLRILFYKTRDAGELQQVDRETSQIQTEMWSAVQAPALKQPTPVMALSVSGMNDVLNSQGYTQAAWWNRIPTSAWGLLILTAIFCNILVGYGARHDARSKLLTVLPIVIAISFLLIADIDAPRGGLIRVAPQNLMSLSQSLSES